MELKLIKTITIQELKSLDPIIITKGCITALVVGVEPEKSGARKDTSIWKRQTVRLSDSTGQINLGLWDNHVGKLEMNKTYEICDFMIDKYEGYNTANLHADGTITEIIIPKVKPQTRDSETFESTKTKYNKIKSIEEDLKVIEPGIENNNFRFERFIRYNLDND